MVLEFGEDIRRCSFGQLKQYLHVQLFATLWIIDRQAPLSMGFSRQEYWSGLPFSLQLLSIAAILIYIPTNSAGDLGDASLIPRSGRSPEVRNGNPLQHSCLENPMDRGVWRATAHVVAREGHD